MDDEKTICDATQELSTTKPTLSMVCNDMCEALARPESMLRDLIAGGDVSGEAAAQTMLAVRHLEDARMRIGKIIQYGQRRNEFHWPSGPEHLRPRRVDAGK